MWFGAENNTSLRLVTIRDGGKLRRRFRVKIESRSTAECISRTASCILRSPECISRTAAAFSAHGNGTAESNSASTWGSFHISKGSDVDLVLHAEDIPENFKGVLRRAELHKSCSELRNAALEVTDAVDAYIP